MKIYLAINKLTEVPSFIDIDMRGEHYSLLEDKIYPLINEGRDISILTDSSLVQHILHNCALRVAIEKDKPTQNKESVKHIPLYNNKFQFFEIDGEGNVVDRTDIDGTLKDSNIIKYSDKLNNDTNKLLEILNNE